MASAQQRPGHHFHDVNSSGSARVQLGDHYGDNNIYHAQGRPETPPAPFSNVPFPRDPDFVDRESITNELEKKLKPPAARVALVGLGGVGKSQLAIEYAHLTRETSPGTFVLWLHASSAARFEHSVRDVLDHLRVPGRTEPAANIYRLLRTWLRETKGGRKWLLILDNADDPRFLVEPPDGVGSAGREERCIDYLPVCEHGALLVTTRSRDPVSRVIRPDDIVDVEPMGEVQACALLEKRLGGNLLCDQAQLSELSKRLDYMPLALAQAASYISQRAPRCSVHEYLGKLHKSDRSQMRLLSRDDGDSRRDREAVNSILLTWQISFEHIRQIRSTAADLLSLMSFFDRQAIPEELLHGKHAEPTDIEAYDDKDHLDENEDRIDVSDSASESESDFFDDDIQTLRSYSFITLTADPSAFEMHRLVQLATQQWLGVNKRLERWGLYFVRALDKSLPYSDPATKTLCRKLYPHAVKVLETKLTEREAILRQISLLHKSGQYALQSGAYADAEFILKNALHAQTKLSARDTDRTLLSMQLLGRAYRLQRRLDEADNLLQEGLPLAQRTSEVWHVSFMREMARVYSLTDRLPEAEKLQLACLEFEQKTYGEESEEVRSCMSDISITYRKSGRYEEAEALLVRVLNVSAKLNGEGMLASLDTMSCLVNVYWQTGRHAEAEKLQVQVLDVCTSKFGEDHPDTLLSMANLSQLLRCLGHWRLAVMLMRKCADMSIQKLRHGHPDTVRRFDLVELWEREDEDA